MKNCGIIEGYFGEPWSFEDRNTYPEFLKNNGYKFFIYAPKNDPFLRKQWDRKWNDEYSETLTKFADICHKNDIAFGIGYTPAGDASSFCCNPDPLLNRIEDIIQTVKLDYFALLFDDLKNNDHEKLASCQITLLEKVSAKLSQNTKLLFCPSYYSTDPILEKVFGPRPSNYWDELGNNLDPKVEIFWTGEKVCSNSYSIDHLDWFAEQFKRRPFLWDNYPVNDGKKLADFLFLKPYDNRPAYLDDRLSGHAINPMREPNLCKITLSTLGNAYQNVPLTTLSADYWNLVESIIGRELAVCVRSDLELFTDVGLGNLAESERSKLEKKYSVFSQNKFAKEIVDYLNGRYAFDPNCLT